MKKHIVLGAIALLTLAVLPTGAFADPVTFFNLGQHVPVFEHGRASSAEPTPIEVFAEPINLGQYVPVVEGYRASSTTPPPPTSAGLSTSAVSGSGS